MSGDQIGTDTKYAPLVFLLIVLALNVHLYQVATMESSIIGTIVVVIVAVFVVFFDFLIVAGLIVSIANHFKCRRKGHDWYRVGTTDDASRPYYQRCSRCGTERDPE